MNSLTCKLLPKQIRQNIKVRNNTSCNKVQKQTQSQSFNFRNELDSLKYLISYKDTKQATGENILLC